MIPAERKSELLTLLEKEKSLTVEELAARIYVSPMTVRRDLKQLENEGFIRRKRGGAEIVEMNLASTSCFSYALRKTVNAGGKKRAAALAVRYIEPGQTIYLDSSSTVSFMAEHLTPAMGLTVVTNSPQLTELLAEKGVNVCCTGGKYSELGMAFFGPFAENSAKHYRIDAMFFSARGIVPGDGIYDPGEENVSLCRCFLERAKRKYFLCDGDKIGKAYLFRVCSVKDVDRVICDVDEAFGEVTT